MRNFIQNQEKCGALPPLVKGDLVYQGVEAMKLDAGQWSVLTSNCEERLRALNWVIGEEDDYDEVTNDT